MHMIKSVEGQAAEVKVLPGGVTLEELVKGQKDPWFFVEPKRGRRRITSGGLHCSKGWLALSPRPRNAGEPGSLAAA